MDIKKVRNTAPLTEFLYSKASRSGIPVSGTFELSPVCNFACRMCYVRKTQKEVMAHNRPIVTLDQWLEIAKEAKNMGMLYLLLTGGEPFMYPFFWELYEELEHMGFLISINSNGSLIDDTVIERLKTMPPTRINITLYGAEDSTYESLCQTKNVFSRVDRAIRGLKEVGIPVKLNCSLTPQNVRDLEKIVAYSKKNDLLLEISEYMFPPLRRDSTMVGRNERFTPEEAAYYHLEQYRLQYGKECYHQLLEQVVQGMIEPLGLTESCVDSMDGRLQCRGGKAAFWVTWDGYMTPCGMMPEPKVELMGRSFSTAWQELGKKSDMVLVSGVCARCSSRKLCHACAAMAIAETGKTSGVPEYLCRMVQEMQKQAHKELEKITSKI